MGTSSGRQGAQSCIHGPGREIQVEGPLAAALCVFTFGDACSWPTLPLPEGPLLAHLPILSHILALASWHHLCVLPPAPPILTALIPGPPLLLLSSLARPPCFSLRCTACPSTPGVSLPPPPCLFLFTFHSLLAPLPVPSPAQPGQWVSCCGSGQGWHQATAPGASVPAGAGP